MAVDVEEVGALSTDLLPNWKAVEHSTTSTKNRKSKKRKHEASTNEELEIDLTLPEPPSKKAARKAKKQKTQKTSSEAKPDAAHAQSSVTAPPSAAGQSQHEEDLNPTHTKRSLFGIWIGNLPYHASTQSLRSFITTQAPTIQHRQITRVHMPAPEAPSHRMYKAGQKPLNKGFAYVDFDGVDALDAAMEISETPFEEGGRRVLIKNAMSFEGRPDPTKPKEGTADGVHAGLGLDRMNVQKPPSKRVFVGNLSFDTSREDLERHYEQCGTVVDVHMATFEDSGKCKGFAWVTFEDADAAAKAVSGFVMREQDGEDGEEGRKKKPRKWFVNKLHGRELRVEFAEDAGYRYRKRFGAETKSKKYSNERRMDEEDIRSEEKPRTRKATVNGKNAHEKRVEVRKTGKQSKPTGQQPDSAKATGAIVEAKGKKITFD